MKKAAVLLVMLFSAACLFAQEVWIGRDGSIRSADSRAMIVDDGRIYLATRKELYKGTASKEGWESIFALPSGENEIRCLAGKGKTLYVGTNRGLFRSIDYGKTWSSIFRTIIPDKNNIQCIALSMYSQQKIVIGTRKGVFLSDDGGDNWKDISFNLKNMDVRAVALNRDTVFVSGAGGLYIKNDSGTGWDRIYVMSPVKDDDQDEIANDQNEEDLGSSISCITLNGGDVYIGADKAILLSEDNGRTWKNFTNKGLSGYVNCVSISSRTKDMYCATTKGVFEFVKDREGWIELYKGMDKVVSITSILFGDEEEKILWALSEEGVYKFNKGRYMENQYADVEKNMKTFRIMSDGEPTYNELRIAAMRFADVDPDKIRNWHNQSRLKALLPKVSVGIDRNNSTNYEIYTSATRDYVVAGPEDMSNGIDVSVSWELGDLVWSTDQTGIDTRSRLTTQLRNDVLDDLRRAYFERKRLQFELVQSRSEDIKERFDKEVRIQELTQAIDDLTGNYLSEHINSAR